LPDVPMEQRLSLDSVTAPVQQLSSYKVTTTSEKSYTKCKSTINDSKRLSIDTFETPRRRPHPSENPIDSICTLCRKLPNAK
uniref:Uncharacterized protein n=1 Tax=Hyaloperonospora arabidopsidis (strain Emoy2) TaxID=559515 RepID=M4C6J9_HYAAE